MALPLGSRPALEPVLPQGQIEKAFPEGMEPCTERVRFSKEESGRDPFDGGFAMKRGILAGAVAEHELYQFGTSGTFSIDLQSILKQAVLKKRLGGLPQEHLKEMAASVIEWVRQYQGSFPPENCDLDWGDVAALLRPQTDLFLLRQDKFRLRVRPDLVVGVGDTLVAVEFTTAKDPTSISEARFALNHHALLREQRRREEWTGYRSIATRVEMLSLGYGFTATLSDQEADQWRLAIGRVAEALVAGAYELNPGDYCSACPWQVPCRYGDERREAEGF